jgi:hypothetical protein
MKQVNTSGKQKRDPDSEEECIGDDPAGVPDKTEDRKCDGNTGKFDNAMEEEIVLEAGEVECDQDSGGEDTLDNNGE